MKADYLTYKRALTISGMGFAIQAVLAATLAIYGTKASDHAAMSAAIYLAIGLIAWFALGLLFDQHRRERIEAMEAESLEASSSAAASAFESTGEELRVAARRLLTIQKWVIPGFSIVIGALLIGVGWMRFGGGRALSSIDRFAQPEHSIWAISISISVALVGFVFARYVSGMGKHASWGPLRGGASAMAGATLVGLAMAVAHFVESAGSDWPLRYLQPAIPLFMMIMGAEVFLNFLLNLYRPRTAGEDHRAAFDSRFLGFLAAPDKIAESIGEAINYQFGVDVTSSWFYDLLRRQIWYLMLLSGVVVWALTSLVVLQPDQRGIILRSGSIGAPVFSFGETYEVTREDGTTVTEIGPGLHVKRPWPFATVEIPEFTVVRNGARQSMKTTTGVRVVQLGSNPPDADSAVLWGKDHNQREILHIVQPVMNEGDTEDDEGGLSDFSLVAAEVPMHYVVTDVELFDRIAAPGQRERLLGVIGKRVVTRTLAAMTVDQVLASARDDLPQILQDAIEREYAKLNNGQGAGIEVKFIGVAGTHPPKDVAANFSRVISAQQNRQAMVTKARQEEIKTLTDVAGSVSLAREIVSKLDELEALERSGADETTLAELEIDVQRLLEAAGGQSGEMLLGAGADRWARHMGERGRAALFAGQEEAFAAAPNLYMTQLSAEAMLEAMRGVRVYITPPGMESFNVRMELQDKQSTRDVFNPEAGAENQ